MATLTASTGIVNLTTPTGWSPAQIPQNGDDLIIGAATLNLDADLTLNTVTFNNAASRLDFTGTTRTVTATNGWFITGAINARLITTTVIAGTTLTLIGTWTPSGSASSSQGLFNFSLVALSGGNVTFATINYSQSSILFNVPNPFTWRLVASGGMSGGILNTYGLMKILGGSSYQNFLSGSSGTYNHYSQGLNEFAGSILDVFVASGNFVINYNGNTQSTLVGTSKVIQTSSYSGTMTFNGFLSHLGTYGIIFINGGVINWTGKIAATSSAVFDTIVISGGQFNYQNQSNLLLETEQLVITLNSGGLSLSGLSLDVFGKFVLIRRGGTLVVSSTTQITSQFPAQVACHGSSLLDNKIIKVGSTTLTFPSVQNVTAGVTYGYDGFLQTGTALQLDPAVLASAISANIPDIVDGVHEADTRDYDDIPGSIGWEFKKLRQANPLVEFTVTNDITPTANQFSVSITDAHATGSFADSVIWFSSGNLTNDNNPILSLVKNPTHSIITLQKPMRIAPAVGDTGLIDPSSHVHSIPEIQNNLALEQSVQDVETAIGLVSDQIDALPTVEQIQTGLALQSTLQSVQTTVEAIPTSISQEDIDAIKSGLALEATSESILTAIGEIDVDFTPILNRLPTELEDGRMASVLSSEQVSAIRNGLALDTTSQNILNGVISLNTNDRGEFF